MRSISEGLGFEITTTTLESADFGVADKQQATIKKTPEVERIVPEELEYAYIRHPITFNSINKATQAIMSAGWHLSCSDENVLEYFGEFLKKIGEVGENVTFEEILESIFQYQMIYGNAYLETVLNKYHTDIVDLVILDPKRIDYAKLSDGRIALDNFGKPIGYIQKWPYEVQTTGKGDLFPEDSEIALGSNEIFLLPERICHFKLYTYGDRFYGQGLIEAAYKSILYEMSIQKANINTAIQRGESPLVDYVGDQLHEPTPQQITNAVENMKDFSFSKYFAFPYWHKIEPINAKPNNTLTETIRILRENIGASLGMPMAFATGSGERTNRATLATQHLFLTFTLNDIVKKTLATLRKYVFQRICEYNKFEEVPEIIWGHIGVEEINEKASRLTNYSKVWDLMPESMKKYVTESERLK